MNKDDLLPVVTGMDDPRDGGLTFRCWAAGRFGARPFTYLGLLLLLATLLVKGSGPLAATGDFRAFLPLVNRSAPAGFPANNIIYGVNFISSAEDPADAHQYEMGRSTGATWNRWPVYWFNIEQSPGQFNWSQQDEVAHSDVINGFQTNAIFLGTPDFYKTSSLSNAEDEATEDEAQLPAGHYSPLSLAVAQRATPEGLFEPIFADGGDTPGPGKQINPANKWAVFVYTGVNRYKPGGLLAQERGWPAGAGITHWEMWNEPDLDIFWDGSLPDFARLQKVGYLAAKQADPNSVILFGALANNFEKLSYYNDVMAIYDQDPLAGPFNYFHDILATHSYFYAWQSWYHVYRAGNTLRARGLEKPIWLNENGVPAWNDYPGPVWDPNSGLRATMSEQADYIIQSAFFAAFAGADAIFHFQLYDACGNQPRGTDFPPHNGELCDAEGRYIHDPRFPCAGDANGLFRNTPAMACFRQHPQPGTARPNLAAFQVLTTYLVDVEPLWRLRPGGSDPVDGPQEWIAFYRPAAKERVLAVWARFGQDETAAIPALNDHALLVSADGAAQTITPVDNHYTLTLPAATNRNAFWDPSLYPIGGRPFILIERDATPPAVTAQVSQRSSTEAVVSWQGDDHLGSGVESYTVSVSVDGAPFTPWLVDTTETQAVHPVEVGRVYAFSATARDRAGNQSAPVVVSLTPAEFDHFRYLPLIFRH